MLFKPIDQVTSGDINGRNIYGSGKTLLVKKDFILTVGVIAKLKKLGVSGIYIKSKNFPNISMEESVSEETKFETLISLYNLVEVIQSDKKIDLQPIKENVEKLVKEIQENRDILVACYDIRTEENKLFIHSLQVCIIAITIGDRLNIKKEGLNTLATTAILHSMITNKTSKSNLVKLNAESAKVFEIYSHLRNVIKFFQEDQNPLPPYQRHSEDSELQRYAEVIALADCFDGLSSQFSNTPAIPPNEAIDFMMSFTESVCKIDVMNAFLRSVSVYPNGHSVKISDGQSGIIVRQNTALPSRPVVGILKGDFHKDDFDSMDVEEIDLAAKTTLFITEVNNYNIDLEQENEKES